MIITQHHEVGQVPGVLKMNPTSPPDLPKQPRTFKTFIKHFVLDTMHFMETRLFSFIGISNTDYLENQMCQLPNLWSGDEMKSEHGRKGDKTCYSLFHSRKLFN